MAGNISLHKSKDLVWKDKWGRIITKVSVVVMLVVIQVAALVERGHSKCECLVAGTRLWVEAECVCRGRGGT